MIAKSRATRVVIRGGMPYGAALPATGCAPGQLEALRGTGT